MAGSGAPDVAIIGGGIVGSALAAELAGRGTRVALYERREIAAGASGRNSGVVWHPSDAVLAALYLESLARYRRLPDELALELPPGAPERGFALGTAPAGILELGWDEDDLRGRATALARTHPALGPTFVTPDELRRLEPGLAEGLAALRMDIGFPVGPASATRALAALAQSRGAVIREWAEASIVCDGGRVLGVRVGGAIEPAGSVVIAAGPWSPALIDKAGSWRPIRPFWGVIVELELGDAAPRHVLEEAAIEAATTPGADAATDDANDDADDAATDGAEGAVGFSLVTAGGRSSLGSTFLPAEPDPRAFEARLRDGGARFVPAIATAPTTGTRACARPLSLDGRPLVGPVPGVERLFIAAGHGPWGISTGPASAHHVAALVMGDPDPRDAAVAAATDAARFGAPPAV